MKLILISPSKDLENEMSLLNFFFENGLENYHLRKPRYATSQLEEYIKKIPEQFHNRIVIHSHHNLAGKYNLKGIHFTKSHLDKPKTTWFKMKLLNLKKPISSLSLSQTYSKLTEVYQKSEFNYEYVFLRSIFDSLSGKFLSGFYEEGLKVANEKSGKKIIARGGVDSSRILQIKDLGFYGFALYSSIWKSKDPKSAYLDILQICNNNGIHLI